MKVISEADVVVALGTRLGPFGSLPQYGFDYWPKNAKIIQVETNHRRLGLTKDIDVGLCGDAKLAAEALSALLAQMQPICLKNAQERVKSAQAIKEEWEAELTGMSVSTEDRMAPRHALRELEKAMPKVNELASKITSFPISHIRSRGPVNNSKYCIIIHYPRMPWYPPTLATFAQSPTAIFVSTVQSRFLLP
jgi:sulfoacetaldehyde acetyltransferase